MTKSAVLVSGIALLTTVLACATALFVGRWRCVQLNGQRDGDGFLSREMILVDTWKGEAHLVIFSREAKRVSWSLETGTQVGDYANSPTPR
jgi:hypothetical protein